MSNFTSWILGIVLLTSLASGCLSIHKTETTEVPPTTVEHRTVVIP